MEHREDEPAVIKADGTKEWWYLGQRHNEFNDEPAVIKANGTKEWWRNGKLGRLNGPAVEYADGRKEWWLHGYNETMLRDYMTKLNDNKFISNTIEPLINQQNDISDPYYSVWR